MTFPSHSLPQVPNHFHPLYPGHCCSCTPMFTAHTHRTIHLLTVIVDLISPAVRIQTWLSQAPHAAARAGSDLTAAWHQFTWRKKQWLDLSGITCPTCSWQEHDKPRCRAQHVRVEDYLDNANSLCPVACGRCGRRDLSHFRRAHGKGKISQVLSETCRLAEGKKSVVFNTKGILIKWIRDSVMGVC